MPQLSNQQYFGLFLGTVTTLMFLNYSRWLQQLKRKILQKRKKDGSVNIGGKFNRLFLRFHEDSNSYSLL